MSLPNHKTDWRHFHSPPQSDRLCTPSLPTNHPSAASLHHEDDYLTTSRPAFIHCDEVITREITLLDHATHRGKDSRILRRGFHERTIAPWAGRARPCNRRAVRRCSQTTRPFSKSEHRSRDNKGLSKRNSDKFKKLSHNFPKLADWAVHWQVSLHGRPMDGNFQTGDISLHNTVDDSDGTDGEKEPRRFWVRFSIYGYFSSDIIKTIHLSRSPLFSTGGGQFWLTRSLFVCLCLFSCQSKSIITGCLRQTAYS